MKELLKNIKREIGEAIDVKEKVWKELIKEWPIEDDMKFSELNVTDKLKNKEFIHMKYYDQFVVEKTKTQVLEMLLEKTTGEQYDYYRFESDKGLTKVEIEKYYLPTDEKIQKIKKLLLFQSFRLDFFEMCVKLLNNWGWSMKNFIDTCKMGI